MLQYQKKEGGRWVDYLGKDKLEFSVSHYKFRLLTKDRSRVLVEGGYSKVLKRMRQVEFFKHKG